MDLTKDILAEKGMDLDEAGFTELMQKQRELARSSRKAADGESWKSNEISFDAVEKTCFVGYTDTECDAKVVALVKDGELCDCAYDGDDVIIVLFGKLHEFVVDYIRIYDYVFADDFSSVG